MPSTEGPASTTGLTNITTVTKASTKPTTGTNKGTNKGLSGEPSPSYKRKILDMSKFSVSLHYLLRVL